MATLMIRSLDERVKTELRVRAARRGVSMEQHARDILERAMLGGADESSFVQRIRQRIDAVAIESLPLPPRSLPRAVAAPARSGGDRHEP